MDPGVFKEISYNEHEGFMKYKVHDPVYNQNRITNITPQKYQYYKGCSNALGSPFLGYGKKNNDFTSPNFVSNSIFYEHSKNLGLKKDDMYTTTNKLHQSKSVEHLNDELRFNCLTGSKSPQRPVPKNNHNRTNMTTIDTALGKNINEIYKQKIGMSKSNKRDSTSTYERRQGVSRDRIEVITPKNKIPMVVNPFEADPYSRNSKLGR
jgi:hypothetical protein